MGELRPPNAIGAKGRLQNYNVQQQEGQRRPIMTYGTGGGPATYQPVVQGTAAIGGGQWANKYGGNPAVGGDSGAGAMPGLPQMQNLTFQNIQGPTGPSISALNPQAAYDPEIMKSLTSQRDYGQMLKAGSGFAMDVLTGAQTDQLEAQVIQARAAAEAAGIPFDEAAFRAQAQRGINTAMAQEKLGREAAYGGALQAESSTVQGMAGERTQRLGMDLERQVSQNRLALEKYGTDVAKYGQDVNKYQAELGAVSSANNALLGIYGDLMRGQMSMAGQMMSSLMSGPSMSQSYSFG